MEIDTTATPITHPRSDGRSENTLRPLQCELGGLQHCDGSAEWKSGSTSVLCAVHGPTAPRSLQHEHAAQCRISVVIQSGAGVSATYEREWEDFLRHQLEACIVTSQYPRCTISVVLHILTADGSVLAACWHAAVSALMDAGIDLRGLPVAVTICTPQNTDKNGSGSSTANNNAPLPQLQLDPVAEEEQEADRGVLVVILLSDKQKVQLLGCHSSNSLRQSPAQILAAVTAAARAVPAVHAFWRLAVEQKVTRESQTLWSGSAV